MLPALQHLRHYAALKNANATCPSLKDLGDFFHVPSQLFVNQRFYIPPLLLFFYIPPFSIAMRHLVKALHVRQLCLNCELRVEGCQTTSWSKKEGVFPLCRWQRLNICLFDFFCFSSCIKCPFLRFSSDLTFNGFHHFNWTVNAYMYSMKYVMLQKLKLPGVM